jgi:predicted flap endonuclease-1-like 5' DNA nuclease
MPSTHKGRLQNPEDPTIDLPATLTFDGKHVQIRSGGETFGQWPLRDFTAEREEANRFSLVIGGEAWTFAADDPADFMVTSAEFQSDPPSDGRLRRFFGRLGSAGLTLGAFSLAVATILTAFAAGVLVGRYRLEGNAGVAVAALFIVVLLSLIRVRAAKKLSPPPSVTARALERYPAKVTRQLDRRGPTDTRERPIAARPRPLLTEKEEPNGHPGLAHIRSSAPADRPPVPGTTDGERRDRAVGSPPPSDGPEPEVTPIAPITEIGTAPDGAQIGAPEVESPPAPDTEPTPVDLASINGIGPAFKERLADLGIEDVADLAALDEDDVAVLMEYLGRFGKRVVTQDWVGQARRLIGSE